MPLESIQKIYCVACQTNFYVEITKDVKFKTLGKVVIIPEVKMLQCPACKHEIIPVETQEKIDTEVTKNR